MSDSQGRFQPLDPGRIDTQSQDEMRYWCRELHCTQARLLEAVTRVGNHVTAVRDDLHLHAGRAPHPGEGGGTDGDRPGKT